MTTETHPAVSEAMREAVALVRQKDPYGCAIACVAMVLGETYEQVKSVVGYHSRGFGPGMWQEYLSRRGVASQMFYRHDCIARADRTPWPLEPWADKHICSVDAGHGDGSHVVVMLRDGSVLDPVADAPRRLSDYPSVLYIAGLHDTGPLASEIARLTGENEAEAAVLTAECKVYRNLAEKYAARADAAEADLTRMRAETERLRTALEPFVAHYEPWMNEWQGDEHMGTYARVTFRQLHAARAALSNPEQTDA